MGTITGSLPVVGFLNGQRSATWARQLEAFREGLGEAGFIEGQNVIIEYRFAEGHPHRLDSACTRTCATERKRDCDCRWHDGDDKSCVKSNDRIPIIVAFGDDPVEAELVASISRPGVKITGVSLFNGTLLAKQIEILHSTLPDRTSLGVLINKSMPTASKYSAIANAAARSLEVALSVLEARTDDEINDVFTSLESRSIGGLAVIGDSKFTDRRHLIVSSAIKYGIPAIYGQRTFVEAGGLMSYGSNRRAVYQA